MVTVARTDIDPTSISATVRRAIAAVDKDQPGPDDTHNGSIYSDSVAQRRFNTALIVAFAALALLLAMVGVYGLMAFAVAQRTHEMGMRIALGAQRGDVLKLVLGRGLRLTLLGIVFGLAAAFFLTRFISNLLFNVARTDPATFIVVSLCLGGIALFASYIPARRARRVDPWRLALRVRAHVTATKPIRRTPIAVPEGTRRRELDEELRGCHSRFALLSASRC